MADQNTLNDDIDITDDEDLLLDDTRIISKASNELIDQETDSLKEERSSEPEGFGGPNSSPDLVDEEDEFRRMIEEGAGATVDETEDIAALGMQEVLEEDDMDDTPADDDSDDLDTLGNQDKF
jgi:hypothetical protein